MKRFLLALFVLGTLTAGAQGFINPQAKLAKKQYERKMAVAKTRGEAVNANARMGLFVTCTKDANPWEVAEALKGVGAKVHGVKAGIISIDIPVTLLEDVAATKGVAIVDVPPRAMRKTDVSRQATKAQEVIDGSGAKLPQAYTGKGVLIGLLDGGFDYSHPMFKDQDGNLRIKGVYKPGISGGGDEQLTYTFAEGNTEVIEGSCYKDPANILDTLKVKDGAGSHGSHCASIAAGSLMSDVKGTSDQPLGGIAPEADLLLINLTDYDDAFVNAYGGSSATYAMYDGLLYLESKSQQLNEPIVTSLSMNSHQGWHDGTSTMARLLSEYCKGDEMPLMLCSSNEGYQWGHINSKIKGGDSIFVGCFPISDSYVWGGMKTKRTVQMELSLLEWNSGTQVCRIPVTFASDNVTETTDMRGFFVDFSNPENLDSIQKIAYDSLKNYFTAGELDVYCYQNQAQDSKGQAYLYTELYVGNQGLKQAGDVGDDPYYVLLIKLKPEATVELHAWEDPIPYIFYFTSEGDFVTGTSDMSMGDWNTSGDPVSVGAWCANDQIKYENTPIQDADRDTSKKGEYSMFSSYGTDLAGHKHPSVCAPGSNVVAAINSFDPEVETLPIYERKGYKDQFVGQSQSRDYFWATLSGTSMATPTAAGVVALWLQAANDMGKKLTNTDIKDIIAHSGDTDKYTDMHPERFGYGKINAYKGLLYVLDTYTSIPTLSTEQPENITFRVAGDVVYADGAEDGTPVTVYNLQGVNVRETTIQGGALSLAGLPQGVYALQLGKLGSTLVRK